MGETVSHLLEVINIQQHFPARRSLFSRPLWVRAVDGVSFHIDQGETLGLVGESGSGKTTLGYMVLLLLQLTKGRILFQERICSATKSEQVAFRRNIQIVFQDPYSSLNPRRPLNRSSSVRSKFTAS